MFFIDILSYQGGFVIINRVYIPAYNDKNSAEYLQFSEEVAAAVSVYKLLLINLL